MTRLAWPLLLALACGPEPEAPHAGNLDAGFDVLDDARISDIALVDVGMDSMQRPPHGDWTIIDDERLTHLQNAVTQGRSEYNLPGLAMAAAYADTQEIMVATDGVSNIAENEVWSTEHSFRIGSVSKTFTAALILQLADEGSIALDDPLERWVPGYYDGLGVTVRHLITNTSGIVSYNYVGSFDQTRSWTPRELVLWAVSNEPELRFAPGSEWEYSNTNYVLLGFVIEAATGSTFETALNTRLLEPLGLEDTYLAESLEPNEHIVRSYDEEDNDISLVADPTFGWAAGGMVSTPCDLARWGASLYGGDVLSAEMLELMVTPGDHNAEYGHGSFVEIDGTQALYGHTGGIGGFFNLHVPLEEQQHHFGGDAQQTRW